MKWRELAVPLSLKSLGLLKDVDLPKTQNHPRWDSPAMLQTQMLYHSASSRKLKIRNKTQIGLLLKHKETEMQNAIKNRVWEKEN